MRLHWLHGSLVLEQFQNTSDELQKLKEYFCLGLQHRPLLHYLLIPLRFVDVLKGQLSGEQFVCIHHICLHLNLPLGAI